MMIGAKVRRSGGSPSGVASNRGAQGGYRVPYIGKAARMRDIKIIRVVSKHTGEDEWLVGIEVHDGRYTDEMAVGLAVLAIDDDEYDAGEGFSMHEDLLFRSPLVIAKSTEEAAMAVQAMYRVAASWIETGCWSPVPEEVVVHGQFLDYTGGRLGPVSVGDHVLMSDGLLREVIAAYQDLVEQGYQRETGRLAEIRPMEKSNVIDFAERAKRLRASRR